MTENNAQPGFGANYAWAGLAVGLLLLGRWTPERLFASEFEGIFWVLKIGVLLALMLIVFGLKSSISDRRIPSIVSFLALMGYVFSSYLWNPFWFPYADSKLADLAYNAALILVVAAGLRHAALRDAFWPVLIAGLGVMALIGAISLPTAIASSADARLAVLGGGPNIFGRNMGLLILACLFFGMNFPKMRMICAGLTGVAFIGVVASGSRGALIATLVGLVALFVLDRGTRRFMLTRPLLIVGFLAVGATAFLLTNVRAVMDVATTRLVEETLEANNLSMRDVLFEWAYNFWLDAPVFGNGLGSFSLVSDLDYPHNIAMEFLCETGVVGLTLFLIFAGLSFLRQIRIGGQERGLVLALVVLLLIAAMISGDFVDSRFLFLFLLYPVSARREPLYRHALSGEPRSQTPSHSPLYGHLQKGEAANRRT